MKFTRVPDPLPGERSVAVEPAPAPFVDAPWRRERFVTGRSISAAALTLEQDHRGGHVALLGRTLRPGIVSGLEVGRDLASDSLRLVVAPGLGLCATGEDVVVPQLTAFDPFTLPTRVPRTLAAPALAGEEEVPLAALAASRGPGAWPLTVVLVAEPVVVETLGTEGEPSDPCERDPDAEPFEDWRWVDAVRLLWVPIEALLDEPDPRFRRVSFRSGVDNARWRNQVAWDLANIESTLDPGQHMPWAATGLPLTLACFVEGRLAFLDRAAVARRGGQEGWADEPVVPGAPAEIRRALVEQFADELDDTRPSLHFTLASRFRHLPPVGVLPRELVDLSARNSACFPAGWGVAATPVPLDQLDAVLRPASTLAPYDTARTSDTVKLLVPVDPRWFSPDLLRVDAVSTDFWDALDEATARRDALLRSRAELRAKLRALYAALGGAGHVPIMASEPAPDLAAEHLAERTLWRNPQSIAVFDQLGIDGADGSLSLTQDVLQGIALAMLQDPALAPTVAAACLGAPLGERVIVAGDPATAGAERNAAAGFVVDATPSHVWMRPAEGQRLVGLAAGSVRVVATTSSFGVQDLDAWIAAAGAHPLVILAPRMDEYAREELEWHHRRTPTSAPTVMLVRGDDAPDRLEDLVARLGSTPGAVSGMAPCSRVAIGAHSLLVSCPSPLPGSAASNRRVALVARHAGLRTDDPERDILNRRIHVLDGAATLLLVGEAVGGTARTARAASTVGRIRTLQELHTGADLAELALLDAAGGAQEAPYGTVPTPLGLGVGLVEELVDTLVGLTTPSDGSRVVSRAELTLLAQLGVGGLIKVLEEKVAKANDVVDLGYLQIQSAVYRLREQMIGRDAAQKMASSPVLGDIAEILDGDTSPDQVAAFFDALRDAASTTPPSEPGSTKPPGNWLEESLKVNVSKAVLDSSSFRFRLTEPLDGMAKATVVPAAALPPPVVVAAEAKLLDGTAIALAERSLFFNSATTRASSNTSTYIRDALAGASARFK